MPNILLVKTSSLGDVIHALPLVSDIRAHFPESPIDWVVEEPFAAIPALHPGVRKVLPVAIRRWRKNLRNPDTREEIRTATARLREERYDIVLDAQGLLKSALVARLAGGSRAGMDWRSAREPLASLFYDYRVKVEKGLHAVERNRLLGARVLGYTLETPADYGIRAPALDLPWLPDGYYTVFLHATSRADKLWPEAHWVELGARFHAKGLRAILPWGNEAEKARAERLAGQIPDAIAAPRLTLDEAAALLAGADVVIGVDTGLAHLAAALDVPVVALYCSTEPGLTGVHGGIRAVNLGGIGRIPSVAEVLTTAERVA